MYVKGRKVIPDRTRSLSIGQESRSTPEFHAAPKHHCSRRAKQKHGPVWGVERCDVTAAIPRLCFVGLFGDWRHDRSRERSVRASRRGRYSAKEKEARPACLAWGGGGGRKGGRTRPSKTQCQRGRFGRRIDRVTRRRLRGRKSGSRSGPLDAASRGRARFVFFHPGRGVLPGLAGWMAGLPVVPGLPGDRGGGGTRND